MRRVRLVGSALWACVLVVLLGSAAGAQAPAAWTCSTDGLGVETCKVTAYSSPAPAPSPAPPAPTEVLVVNPSAVPVREVAPLAPAGTGCGAPETPCVVESGLDTMAALGALGLAGVLIGGVRIAQGLRG